MNAKTTDDRGTITIDGLRIKTFQEISAITSCLIIGFLCLFLVTLHLDYNKMNNTHIKMQQDSSAVQMEAFNSPLWIAVSRIGLFMHPMRDCVESLATK
jgi:hypothetical protein